MRRKEIKASTIRQDNDATCFNPGKWARSKHNKAAKRLASRRLRELCRKLIFKESTMSNYREINENLYKKPEYEPPSAESELASLCDAINTWAREVGSKQCTDWRNIGPMRDALDGICFALLRRSLRDTAYDEACYLFKTCAPQCECMDTTSGVLSQLDNYIAGLNSDIAEHNKELSDMKAEICEIIDKFKN